MAKAKQKPANFEIIHGPTVLTALHNAIDMFKKVQAGRFSKAHYAKAENYNQEAVNEAIALADKFKAMAGQLSPGSDKAYQALQKIMSEVK